MNRRIAAMGLDAAAIILAIQAATRGKYPRIDDPVVTNTTEAPPPEPESRQVRRARERAEKKGQK